MWRWVTVLGAAAALTRLVLDGLTRDGVLLSQPGAEIDQPAALAAEGPEGGLRPVDLAVTGGALDALGGHQEQQVNRNLTSAAAWAGRSVRPFQLRKRTLQR